MVSPVCPGQRTERPRKTKIGTEVGHSIKAERQTFCFFLHSVILQSDRPTKVKHSLLGGDSSTTRKASILGLGYWPMKICRKGQSIFWTPKMLIFYSKLLLDNSASFVSSRMKDLRLKWKAKLIRRRLKQFDGLTWLTWPPILRYICASQWRNKALRGPGSTVTWGPPFPSPPLPLPPLRPSPPPFPPLSQPSPSPAAKRPSNPARGSGGAL